MAQGKFVSYIRVSTARQGRSGLGLEAQRKAVEDFLNGNGWEIVGEFTEVESGKKNDRPELEKALGACRLHQATLVIAKIDRLARNQQFLMGLVDSGADVVFCDLPDIPPGAVGRFMLQQMAAVAELEAGLISERTKSALAQAKERGTVLGGFRGYIPTDADRRKAVEARQAQASERDPDLLPIVEELQGAGVTSLRGIASALNERSIPAPKGGTWFPNSVARLLARVA